MLAQSLAVSEIGRSHALASFQLQFQQLQGSGAAPDARRFQTRETPRAAFAALVRTRSPDMQRLASEPGIGARPRFEAPHPVMDRARRLAPIDEPVFLLENR